MNPQNNGATDKTPIINKVAVPRPNTHTGEFSTGMFDCFSNMSMCCDAWCCSWCVVAYQDQRINHSTAWARGDHMNTGLCLGGFCIDVFFTGGLFVAFKTCGLRGQLRERYGIQGGEATDCLASLCCRPCTISQMSREMARHGEYAGGVCAKQPQQPEQQAVGQQPYPAVPYATTA